MCMGILKESVAERTATEPFKSVSQQRWFFSALGVFVFSMAANGFAYFNYYPQHDSINHSLYFAGTWEVSLGRFLLPVWGTVFGDITAPWMIGFLSMITLTCATFLITDLFQLNSWHLVFLMGGLFSANITVTEMCASFIYVDAPYLLAFLLSTLSMYIVIRHPGIPAAVSSALVLSVSMGFYQAYVSTALLLLLFSVAKDVLTDRHLIRGSLRKWAVYALTLLLALVFYVVEYVVSMKWWGVTPADSGNSPARLLTLPLQELFHRLKIAYKCFLDYFYLDNRALGDVFAAANIVLTVIAAVLLVCYLVQKKLPLLNHIVLLLLLVMYPVFTLLMGVIMGTSGIYFIISFALVMFYPGLLFVITRVKIGEKNVYSGFSILRKMVVVMLAIVLWRNIVFSNGAYTTQKLLYDRTVSITTRILDDIDETPGYVMKETPVVVIGTFHQDENLDIITTYCDFLSGFHKISTTYTMTFDTFTQLMGYKLNIENDSEVVYRYQGSDAVQQMPTYPEPGYCQMVEGALVVKLSQP